MPTYPAPLMPGGIAQGGQRIYSTVPRGDVPPSMLGTNLVVTAGTWYMAEVIIPRRMIVHSVGWLNGNAVTGLYYAIIWNPQGFSGETTPADSSRAVSGANSYQVASLNQPYCAQGPGRFWIHLQFSDATEIRVVAANTYDTVMGAPITGLAFNTATQPGVSPNVLPTAFVADVTPFAFVVED